jgi:Uma2 family endonuclease
LTTEQEHQLFMLMLEDDTEDAPWMVMGDLQFWSASGFAQSLRIYAHEQGLAWYVAAMLPINFRYPGVPKVNTLAPDTFVSFVSERARTSYDVEKEGMFPPFVLEVVSPSSTSRDRDEKRLAYELMGVREYALFTPREEAGAILEGYRRGEDGAFAPWQLDEEGRLWSEVLELYLVARGALVQAQTREGRLLLTPEQEAMAHRHEAQARLQAEEAYAEEIRARQRAEEELEQLRRELERYKGHGG